MRSTIGTINAAIRPSSVGSQQLININIYNLIMCMLKGIIEISNQVFGPGGLYNNKLLLIDEDLGVKTPDHCHMQKLI